MSYDTPTDSDVCDNSPRHPRLYMDPSWPSASLSTHKPVRCGRSRSFSTMKRCIIRARWNWSSCNPNWNETGWNARCAAVDCGANSGLRERAYTVIRWRTI